MAFSFFNVILAQPAAVRSNIQEQQDEAQHATLVSAFAGQRLNVGRDECIIADGQPAVLINDDHVKLNNAGLLSSTGLASTVSAQGERALVNNTYGAEIMAETTGIGVDGVRVVKNGDIIGTGDQRNGTVYADGTADDYTITNGRRGLIDAGQGNVGSAVALQTGDVAGDTVKASVRNDGLLQGRGDEVEGNTVGDGVRIFSNNEDVTFEGDVVNNGTIAATSDSDTAAAISLEDGVCVIGKIVNNGRLTAEEVAIDASEAGGSVKVLNNGRIEGDVILSDGDDSFAGGHSRSATVVDGGAGDDQIATGRGNDLLTGGLGDDLLNGGRGRDTALLNDAEIGVKVDLQARTATRETGFTVNVEDQPLASLTTDQSPEALVAKAAAGNLYYNIHSQDFPGGEIRGQLLIDTDVTQGGVRTLTLRASLDSAQEPGPLSVSAATGTGVVTIVLDGHGETYSSELTVTGINQAGLFATMGPSFNTGRTLSLEMSSATCRKMWSCLTARSARTSPA